MERIPPDARHPTPRPQASQREELGKMKTEIKVRHQKEKAGGPNTF
jgi:hypothetical protein